MCKYTTTHKQTGSQRSKNTALTAVLEGEEEDYLLNNRTVLACVIVCWFIKGRYQVLRFDWFIKRRWWVLRYCVISLVREDVRY